MKFFVVGHGRSGTMWLSQLLNASPGIKVFHEKGSMFDMLNYFRAYNNQDAACEFISRRLASVQHGPGMGEVNSFLRYSVPELHKFYDGCTVVGLIRNGFDVVQSLHNRNAKILIKPIPDYVPNSRVGQLAWYWAQTYNILDALKPTIPVYRLEDLVSNDSTYYELLCMVLDIEPDLDAWNRLRYMKINKSINIKPTIWDEQAVDDFLAVAKEIHLEHLYRLEPQ